MADQRIFVFRKEDGLPYVWPERRVMKNSHTLEFINFTELPAHVVFDSDTADPPDFWVVPYDQDKNSAPRDKTGTPMKLAKPPTLIGKPNYHRYHVTLSNGQSAIGGSDPGIIIDV